MIVPKERLLSSDLKIEPEQPVGFGFVFDFLEFTGGVTMFCCTSTGLNVVSCLMNTESLDKVAVGLIAPPYLGQRQHFKFLDRSFPTTVQEMQYHSPSGITSIP